VLFRRLFQEWQQHDLSDVAGTVTFFGVLALFPFLIFVVALAAHIVSPQMTQALLDELARVAPAAVSELVAGRVRSLVVSATRVLTLSLIGTLWASASGVAALITALNRAFDVVETRPYWKTRGLALLTTLGAGLLALLAAVIAVAMPAVARGVGGRLGTVLGWLRMPIAGILMIVLWALLYHFLPNVHPKFQVLTPGSVIGVVVWLAASFGFSTYVSHFGNYELTYGALGGFVVLLMWMWISAQAFLFGAEINKVLTPPEDKPRIATRERPSAPPHPPRATAPARGSAWVGLALALGYFIGRRRGA
jgi:membrane protein